MSQNPNEDASSSKIPISDSKAALKRKSSAPGPAISAARQLGSIRASKQDSVSGSSTPTAIGNQAKIADASPSSSQVGGAGGLVFTPSATSARPAPKKLNFKAKVVGTSSSTRTESVPHSIYSPTDYPLTLFIQSVYSSGEYAANLSLVPDSYLTGCSKRTGIFKCTFTHNHRRSRSRGSVRKGPRTWKRTFPTRSYR